MKKGAYFLVFLNIIFCNAQKESHYWYFGNKSGLNFNTNPVSISKNNLLKTFEGSSVISDVHGNLIFYTDGSTVWNKNHKVMANGTDLSGDSSATQSAVIVPMGISDRFYYIFTVGAFRFPDGVPDVKFEYSIVDMHLEKGLGRVIEKNKPLFTSTTGNTIASCEKIAAIQHKNGRDFWIVGHDFRIYRRIVKVIKRDKYETIGTDEKGSSGDTFFVYLLTEKGIEGPQKYKLGKVHYDARGYMKISKNGKHIAVAVNKPLDIYFKVETMEAVDSQFKDKEYSFVELFDFDEETGTIFKRNTGLSLIKNPLDSENKSFYGLEFSENGKYLYASDRWEGRLYQFEIATGKQKIIDSKNLACALQLAPDGKMYAAMAKRQSSFYSGETHLGVIENSNTANPIFKAKALDLQGGKSYEGLPTIVSTFYNSNLIIGPNICTGEALNIKMDTKGYTEYVLEMGDGKQIKNKIPQRGKIQETYQYTKASNYKITLTLKRGRIKKQIQKSIVVFAAPEKPILNKNKITLCNTSENKGIIQNFNANYTYRWENENGTTIGTSKEQIFTKIGKYKIIVKNKEGCETETPFFVAKQNIPEISQKKFNITHSEHKKGTFTFFDKKFMELLSKNYEFGIQKIDSPENVNYQSELYFENLESDVYHFYVREKGGCNVYKFLFAIVNFPKYFSPNGDGIHDLWQIKNFREDFFGKTQMYIMDKTGNLLRDFDIKEGWDGKNYNGKIMPSDDYWYKVVLKYPSGRAEIKIGHFSLLR